jgi:mono/diheme cytochrome c family protein
LLKSGTIFAAIAAAALAGIVGTSGAAAAGDAAAGHALALQWCTGCHVVDGSGAGHDAAPPFLSIAREHKGDHAWLRAWLNSPHPAMPNFDLARQQIDDIVAYLDSLVPR